MAVPSITNVYPTQGHTGGKTLVRLLGNAFAENISVTFDGAEAREVMWINHALVYAVTPISPLQDSTTGAGNGAVDVAVQNLDDDDNPIGGETATFADGYTYVMPSFALRSTVERACTRLREELRRQVWKDVIHRKHADYAEDTAAIRVDFSTLPAIALIGPQVIANPIYKTNHSPIVQGLTELIARQPPLTVDLQFGLVGGYNKDRHGYGLMEATLGFFKKNIRLQMDKDENDPSKGNILLDLEFVPDNLPAVVSAPNESNVSAFSGTVGIVGLILEGFSTIDLVPESDFFKELIGGPPVLDTDTYAL